MYIVNCSIFFTLEILINPLIESNCRVKSEVISFLYNWTKSYDAFINSSSYKLTSVFGCKKFKFSVISFSA